MINTERTGSTRTNSKRNNSNSSNMAVVAVADLEASEVLATKAHTGHHRMAIRVVFSDFFESMFGSRRGRSGAGESYGFRGQDYSAELQLSLADAAKTYKQVITVNGKNLRITVPAGIANGQKIKLKGQGGPGANGGPAGDLYITFIIPEDNRFKRVGNDIYITANIDMFTAILGGEVIIDTMEGKVKLKVKPGTQNNTKARLKGKGFPVYKKEGSFGDLIITYNVEIPTDLTEKQKELLKEIQSLNKK